MKKIYAVLIAALAAAILFPTMGEANSGDFSGGISVGSSYAGSVTAPINGAVVQGNVGIGTSSPAATLDVNGTANAGVLTLNSLPMPFVPGGRLTLSSTAAVATADVVNATSIYYLPYVGQNIPVYNGTGWTEQDMTSSGLALSLNSTNMPTTEVFDIYASIQSGSMNLCALYWGNNTSRSSTAGGKSGSQDARIVQLNGVWVNKTAIAASNCYNGTTSYTIAQNQGTYLGSFYTTSAGKTGIFCTPLISTSYAGGSNSYIGLYNAYNRLPLSCEEFDTTFQWTYSTPTYRMADNSSGNRITFVDGLQQTPFDATYNVSAGANTLGVVCANAMGLDGINPGPPETGVNYSSTTSPSSSYKTMTSKYNAYPVLGLHYLQAQDYAGAATCTFNAGGNQMGMFLLWNGF